MEMKTEDKYISTDYEQHGGDYPPSDPKGLMAWFAGKIAEIPEGSREKARIECCSYTSYGDDYGQITISYTRPETAEEMRERVGAVKARAFERESAERAALAQLKAKYES